MTFAFSILMLGVGGTLCFVLFSIYASLAAKDQIRPVSEPEIGEKHRVSVVICAHNEAQNLRLNLPKILAQDYHQEQIPRYEVIVVNDRSEDDSKQLLEEFQRTWPQLVVVTISADEPRTFPGKKYALAKGVQAAKNDWILCTDADCAPSGNKWLQKMVAPLQNGKEIVAGFGAFNKEDSWLNAFVRYETLHTFHSLQAFAAAGLPYMAVGRNMAFHRSVFIKAQQHPAWSKIPSGDDDLLVSFCATKDNFAVVQHPDSFTWTNAEKTLASYLHQKQRHVSTGKFYPFRVKMLLGLWALSLALWWLLSVGYFGLIFPHSIALFCAFTIPIFAYCWLLQHATKRLQLSSNYCSWLLFLFCWTCYNTVLAPYILWKNKMRWK